MEIVSHWPVKAVSGFLVSIVMFTGGMVAQNSLSDSLIVKIFEKRDASKGTIELEAAVLNKTEKRVQISYQFLVSKSDNNNNTTKSTDSNTIVLKPKSKTTLSLKSFNLGEIKIQAEAAIYYQGNRISEDRFTFPGKKNTRDKDQNDEGNKDQQIASLSEQQREFRPGNDAEILGLVIDQTLTPVGREFYEYFFTTWQTLEPTGGFTIIVKEEPFQGFSTKVSVSYNDQVVFQQFLSPRRTSRLDVAKAAIREVYQVYQNPAQGPSIDRATIEGTGVY